MENKIYNAVPNIITGKDLDYLSDIFNWNYIALKKTNTAITQIKDEQIKNILEKGFKLFNNNINYILSILNDGGNYE